MEGIDPVQIKIYAMLICQYIESLASFHTLKLLNYRSVAESTVPVLRVTHTSIDFWCCYSHADTNMPLKCQCVQKYSRLLLV